MPSRFFCVIRLGRWKLRLDGKGEKLNYDPFHNWEIIGQRRENRAKGGMWSKTSHVGKGRFSVLQISRKHGMTQLVRTTFCLVLSPFHGIYPFNCQKMVMNSKPLPRADQLSEDQQLVLQGSLKCCRYILQSSADLFRPPLAFKLRHGTLNPVFVSTPVLASALKCPHSRGTTAGEQ